MLRPALLFAILAACLLAPRGDVACAAADGSDHAYDVVIYGGTSSGAIASVQAARMGKRVCLICAGRRLGGLTAGGLGATDIGNKESIGGLSRDFYRRVGAHYGTQESWRFEPHVAEETFEAWVKEAGVDVYRSERLNRQTGVEQDRNGRILSVTMASGRRFRAPMFIDASYEADLMAAAHVDFTVGREANDAYRETVNGVEPGQKGHQFKKAIDPYVIEGDPKSGLLPGIHAGGPGQPGQADGRVQAYNFRLCLTDRKDNQLPFPKPAGYDPARYELLLRYIRAGVFDLIDSNLPVGNGKTDLNNNGAVSTDDIGMSDAYPTADDQTRQQIFQEHVNWQQGLLWFAANDPRVPAELRAKVNRWGLCRDEFVDTGGWSDVLYVREARRMIGPYVMTQHNCQGRAVVDDSIGLGAYGMDSHNTQRYVDDSGHVRNEGDVQVGGFSPYPIAYRAITPKQSQCPNLLVPVCLSASHIGYGSIRMEPVFMILGQSAGTAACQALDQGVPVQRVSIAVLQKRLTDDHQILKWKAPATRPARR